MTDDKIIAMIDWLNEDMYARADTFIDFVDAENQKRLCQIRGEYGPWFYCNVGTSAMAHNVLHCMALGKFDYDDWYQLCFLFVNFDELSETQRKLRKGYVVVHETMRKYEARWCEGGNCTFIR